MFDWDHGPHWFQINQSATRIFCNDPWSPHAMDVPRCAEVCGQQWRSSRRNCCKTVGLCNIPYIYPKRLKYICLYLPISPPKLWSYQILNMPIEINWFPYEKWWCSIVFPSFFLCFPGRGLHHPIRPGDPYAVPKDRFVAQRLAASPAVSAPLARRIKATARRWAMPREEGYPSLSQGGDDDSLGFLYGILVGNMNMGKYIVD